MNHLPTRAGVLGALSASMLIFGTIGLFRRWIPVSSPLLALTRAVLGTAFLLLFLEARKQRMSLRLPGGKLALLMLSGALIGFNWILLFESYRFTTVAVATLCYYTQPTILILLSPVFFRERLTRSRLLCAVAAVAGMVLISGVDASVGDGRGIVLGMGAATLYAAVVVLNKKTPGVDPLQRTVIQLAAAALTVLPYVLLTEDWGAVHLAPSALAVLLVVGLVHTGLAYALYFSAVEALSAQTIALMSYIDPVSALLLSALLLREPLGLRGALGAVLILVPVAVSELRPARITNQSSKTL